MRREEDMLAAEEYVLGLMSEAEAEAFEARMAQDADVAACVGEARDRLLPLDLSAHPVEIPAGFRDGLRERIARSADAGRGQAAAAVRARRTIPARAPRAPLRVTLGLLAASIAGVAIGLAAGWQRPVPDPQVIAVLVDENGVPQAIIEDYGDATARIRFVADLQVPPDRVIQAWTLPSQEMGATSLGIMATDEATLLEGPELPRPSAQQLYEITLEPRGGSPTGRPTGPILGKGFAAVQG